MLATVSLTIARGHIGSQSARLSWAKSMGCGAATFFLWSFTGNGPFVATFLIANLFAIFAVPLGITAFSQLFGSEFYCLAFVAYISATSIALFALNNEKNRRETIERLRRDGLTGLYTRTAFFEMLPEIEQRGRAQGYSLLLIDIDYFKSINDKFGHCGGDVVLAHVGRMLANTFRLSDLVVRYGGEEFCVVLHGCEQAEAAKYADRLVVEANRQRVRWREGRSTKLTLSIGYASVMAAGGTNRQQESLQSVITRADKALYRAKESGRNQSLQASTTEFA